MVDAISIQNGQAEAAYAGERPWHGLGTRVEDLMSPFEALEAAHMNWHVSKRAMFYNRVFGGPVKAAGVFATVREDTQGFLGTVGNQYVPFQNREQADFIEALIGEGAGSVEMVGALFNGSRTFWTVRHPKDLEVAPGDKIEKYLVLCNGHDGSLAFRAFYTPIRVVCNNTLSAALSGFKASEGISIRHTSKVSQRVEEARLVLQLQDEYYQRVEGAFHGMIQKTVDARTMANYVEKLFPSTQEEVPTRTLNLRQQVLTNFANDIRNPGHGQATVWDLYNAATFYTSHQMKLRGEKKEGAADRKMNSVVLGRGRKVAQKAFDLAVAMAA